MEENRHLYEIGRDIDCIVDMLSQEDIDPQVVLDTLDGVSGELADKCESIALVIKDYRAMSKSIGEEVANLNQRKKVYDKKIEFLQNYLAMGLQKYLMANPKAKCIETPKVKLSFRTSKAVKLKVDEETFINIAREKNWDVLKQTTEISLTNIKELLTSGVDMEGLAGIEETKSLQIK